MYGNTVIGTLAVDGWAVTFGTARRGLSGLAVPNVTAHPSTASVPTSYYLMLHYNWSTQPPTLRGTVNEYQLSG